MDNCFLYIIKCRLIAAFLLSISGFFGISQEVSVLDEITKTPVPYANVRIGTKNLVTDVHGKFILNSDYVKDTALISAIGYQDAQFTWSEIFDKKFIIYLNPSSELLDAITISGSRWKEKSKNHPLKIERLGKTDVRSAIPQTSADLLGEMNHVFIQKSQLGGGSPMIRGFSTSRVLIAVDGVRMNNAIFRSGNLQNVLSVDPMALESVEVSYGPGAVLYGSDAIGGVMNFFTLTPELSKTDRTAFHLNTSLRYSGANNEKTMHVDASLGNSKIGFLSSLSYSNFGDLRMGSHGPTDYLDEFIVFREGDEDGFKVNPNPEVQSPTAYNQISALQKVKYALNKNDFLTYSIYYSQLSDVPRYDRMILTRDNSPRYGRWDYGPQKWLFQNIKYYSLNNNSFYDQMAFIIGHQNYEESRLTRDFNDAIENNRIEKLNIYSVNFDLRKSMETWDLYYGLETVYNDVDSEGLATNLISEEESVINSRYPDSKWFSLGAYFSVRKKMSEKISLNSGVRVNNFNIQSEFENTGLPFVIEDGKLNFTTLSGNIGVVHNLSPRHTLNYIISTGMRAPNVDDIGKIFDSVPGNVVVPNQNLRAEIALNTEINYNYTLGDRMVMEAGIYYTHLNHAMVRRDFTISGSDSIIYDGVLSKVQAIQNAADAYVVGLQFGMNYRISNTWLLKGTYNFQKGEEESDDGTISNSRHVAPGFGKFAINYNNKVWFLHTEINGQGGVSYTDLPVTEKDKPEIYAADENGNPFAPSWWTLNVKWGRSFTDHTQLIMGIDNVLDKRYRPFSSGISAPGFNFYISFNYGI